MTFLLIGLLLLQGAPLTATQGGTVIGVVKGADGKPRARIRVAAVLPPETVNDRSAGVMAAIAQTDDEGRYVLQASLKAATTSPPDASTSRLTIRAHPT